MGLSPISLKRLESCNEKLQQLTLEVAKHFPCLVVCGHRDEKDQNDAFAKGTSKLPWPKGNHNSLPSQAVDLAPLPYDAMNSSKILYFSGFVMATALRLGIAVRWGGDWNQNLNPSDEKFRDLYHFELI